MELQVAVIAKANDYTTNPLSNFHCFQITQSFPQFFMISWVPWDRRNCWQLIRDPNLCLKNLDQKVHITQLKLLKSPQSLVRNQN